MTANPEEQLAKTPSKRSKTLWWFTGIIVLAAIVWLLYWLFYLQFHEFTDDAYANGNMIQINPAVPGNVVAFYADDTDLVVEGQLLVELDSTPYKVEFERELATLRSTVLEVKQLYDNVQINVSNVESKEVIYRKAQYDFENRSKLVSSKAISNEEFIHSQEDLEFAGSELEKAKAELKTALDAISDYPIEKHPRIEAQKGRVRTAYYQLTHCSIYAPSTGYVAQRVVEVGQWAATTTPLMAIIPKDYMWVDANFKETQLKYMRVGQPASITFDLYGSSVQYTGKVLGIASGTGSVFSVIPPQNATGNWIKIVQRLPVRISLDPQTLEKYPARLGLTAEVNVNIGNQDLPMLVQVPNKRPISTTQVFDIGLEEINVLMDHIIKQNINEWNTPITLAGDSPY